ncbi:MAG TPA: MucB/RseB C-terminal domain-containing protein [Burkholderiales bacterium]|nr:MucB/RseB C-terminal domain-containing protein [Burkholderiales bacterium]
MRLPLAALAATALAAQSAIVIIPAANAETQTAPLELLKKIASAARDLNYAGTFVYQHGNQVETSRITHSSDQSGDYAKLEALDGPPREIIRSNDEIRCYLPESKTVKIETRKFDKSFPALLPEGFLRVTEHYNLTRGPINRVAGHTCQVLVLEPKDNLRYGRTFCAETETGLLLKARTLNEKEELVEQIAFTHLIIGAVDREMLKSKYAGEQWKVDHTASPVLASKETGWAVKSQPAGFKKIMEMRRHMAGKTEPVSHLVFSDGLAAVSVFIEPVPKGKIVNQSSLQQGAINVHTRAAGEHMITVLGEAPAATVMQIASSVAPVGK